MKKIKTVILGAGGYTGAELLRFLLQHPNVEIIALTGDSQVGKNMAEVFPHLAECNLPPLVAHEQVDFSAAELVFCCLPHGTTQEIIAALPKHLKIIDLSADFRLRDINSYHEWYGHPHAASDLQISAVYGLTEHYREQIKTARLIANPGCYPTASLLPLLPLLKAQLVTPENIIIDAKSGISGAGRSAKRELNFSETSEGMSAYGIANHRHTPEIEQELERAAAKQLKINFTPHLIPMRRGMLATIYAQLTPKTSLMDARNCLESAYNNEKFVHITPENTAPSTHHVRGSNHCRIGIFAGRQEGSIIIISAIDNLVKGASGQAIQNMNLMFGLAEDSGLKYSAVFP